MQDNQVEILLIEDNPNDAEMTIRALKKSKVSNHIQHISNGALALDYLFGTGEYATRDTNNKPRVILLDLKMPLVDGMEVLVKIKENDETKNIPIVILTSSNEHPDIEKCYKLGANSYIVKPVEFESFMHVVKELGLYWLILNQAPPL